MKHLAVAVALMLSVESGATAQTTRRPMTLADRFDLQDIGEVQIAPDAARIAFTVSTSDLAANNVRTRLMTMARSGGTPADVPSAPDGPGNLRWSPDGTRLAFIGSRDGKAGVWVLDAGSGAVTRVCDYERGNSFLSKAGSALAWSPDGRQLAFAGTLEPAPPPPDPLIVTRLQYKTRTSFSDNRRSHIFVVQVAGGMPRAVTSGTFDEHSIDWGGDGSEIVFLSNRAADPDVALNYDIYAVNVASGNLRRITDTPGVEMDPRLSPDGRTIAYSATTRAVTTIDSVAEDAHIFVVPTAGGQPTELNHALDRRSSAPDWSGDGNDVLFTAADHGKTALYRVAADGGTPASVVDRPGQVGPFSIARRTGTLAFGWTDPMTPREISTMRLGEREPIQVTSLNQTAVNRWGLVTPETISFKSFDGTPIEGWLYPALNQSSKSPLILSIHGGPHGQYTYAFNAAFQLNAARGYATLALNPRGSSGYGQAFSDGCVGNWGGGDYKDLMAGVDHVLSTHTSIDPERLGVTGGSYGGYMTNWVITQTNRFKVAVSLASVSNLASFYATSLYQDLVHAEFNGFPWDGANWELLWKWSPMAWVKRAKTPTLFIHGEQDNDVHITQAEEIYTALRRQGIEAVLARYPREGHGFREPKHQLDQAERTLAFMDRFLMASGKPTQP